MIKCLLTELVRPGGKIFGSHSWHKDLTVPSLYIMSSSQIFSCPALSLSLQIHNMQKIVTRFKVRGFWSNTKKSAVWISNNYYNKVYPDIFLPPASTKIKSHQMDVTWFLMTLTKQCCPFCKLKFCNLSKPQSILRVKCFKRGSYSKSESLTMPMITIIDYYLWLWLYENHVCELRIKMWIWKQSSQ